MRIRFEVTVDDLVAFSQSRFDHLLPGLADRRRLALRELVRTFLWTAPLLLLLVWSLPLEWSERTLAVTAVLGLVLIGQFFNSYSRTAQWLRPQWVRTAWIRQTRRWSLRKAAIALGPQELELKEKGLLSKRATGVSSLPFAAIDLVVTEGRHTFLFFNDRAVKDKGGLRTFSSTPYLTHVIPLHSITEGDRDAFVEALHQRVATDHAARHLNTALPGRPKLAENT